MSTEPNQVKKSKFRTIIVSIGFTFSLWVLWVSFGTVMSSCSNNPDMTLASNYVQHQLALNALGGNGTCGWPPFLGSYYDPSAHLQQQVGNTIRFSMWKTTDPGQKYYVHDWYYNGSTIVPNPNGYNPALSPSFSVNLSGIPVLNYWIPKPGLVSSYTFAFQVKDMCICSSGSSTLMNANYHYLKVTTTPNNPPYFLNSWTDTDLTFYCNAPLPITI